MLKPATVRCATTRSRPTWTFSLRALVLSITAVAIASAFFSEFVYVRRKPLVIRTNFPEFDVMVDGHPVARNAHRLSWDRAFESRTVTFCGLDQGGICFEHAGRAHKLWIRVLNPKPEWLSSLDQTPFGTCGSRLILGINENEMILVTHDDRVDTALSLASRIDNIQHAKNSLRLRVVAEHGGNVAPHDQPLGFYELWVGDFLIHSSKRKRLKQDIAHWTVDANRLILEIECPFAAAANDQIKVQAWPAVIQPDGRRVDFHIQAPAVVARLDPP